MASADLWNLLEQSRADPTIVTIEATVVTGFEPVAQDECREKIEKSLNNVIARGRVYFNVPVTKINLVEKLRSVDNLYLLIKVVPNVQFSSTSSEENMQKLKKEFAFVDVARALTLWTKINNYKGVLYPSAEMYSLAVETEFKIKELAKSLARVRIKDSVAGEGMLHSVHGASNEKARYNTLKCAAYNEIDKRNAEDKMLKFRVTCTRIGEHCFSSQDAAYHVGGNLQDMFLWVVDLNLYDLDVVLNIRNDSMYYGMALTKESKHHRNIRVFGPTTLRATICYNMLKLAEPKLGEVVVDPLCGGGSIPIEGCKAYCSSYYICGDNHEKAVTRCQLNIEYPDGDKKSYIDLLRWDVTKLPLRDSSVDIFITDLPFGKRSGSVSDNRILYKKILVELARVVSFETGRAVILTYDKRSITAALSFVSGQWKLTRKWKINVGGLNACVYVLLRLRATVVLPPTTSRKSFGADGDGLPQS